MIRGRAVSYRGGAGRITHETLHQHAAVAAAQAALARERAVVDPARMRRRQHRRDGDQQIEHREASALRVTLDGPRRLRIYDLEDALRLDQRDVGVQHAGMVDAFGERAFAVQFAEASRGLLAVGVDDADDAGLAGSSVDGAPEGRLRRAADLLQQPESQVGRAGVTRRIAFNGSDRHVIPFRAL